MVRIEAPKQDRCNTLTTILAASGRPPRLPGRVVLRPHRAYAVRSAMLLYRPTPMPTKTVSTLPVGLAGLLGLFAGQVEGWLLADAPRSTLWPLASSLVARSWALQQRRRLREQAGKRSCFGPQSAPLAERLPTSFVPENGAKSPTDLSSVPALA